MVGAIKIAKGLQNVADPVKLNLYICEVQNSGRLFEP